MQLEMIRIKKGKNQTIIKIYIVSYIVLSLTRRMNTLIDFVCIVCFMKLYPFFNLRNYLNQANKRQFSAVHSLHLRFNWQVP